MIRRFLTLAATATLVVAVASPAAAYMPAYMKFCGVDGESKAQSDKPKKAPKAQRPRADRTPAPRASAAQGYDLKKSTKPARGLIVPAIQKARD